MLSVQDITTAIETFVSNNKAWTAPLMFVLAFGESLAFVSLVLPFWGILVAVGALREKLGLGFVPIWLAASAGAALGDWLSYWLGWHYHEKIAKMWPLSRYPDLLPKGHAFFEKWGAWAIVFGRFSGPFRASVPIVAGTVQMPSLTFQIANWASALLWAGLLLKFGDVISFSIEWIWGFFKK